MLNYVPSEHSDPGGTAIIENIFGSDLMALKCHDLKQYSKTELLMDIHKFLLCKDSTHQPIRSSYVRAECTIPGENMMDI
jgi:hypothetical protein